jgi:hypothetical protein
MDHWGTLIELLTGTAQRTLLSPSSQKQIILYTLIIGRQMYPNCSANILVDRDSGSRTPLLARNSAGKPEIGILACSHTIIPVFDI